MARTSIPVTEIPFQGSLNSVVWTAADAVNGMMFPNDGNTLLLIRNTDAAAHNVTVVSVPDEAGRTGDKTINVANGATAIVPPLRPVWWNQRAADRGNVYVNFDAAAGMSVAAVRLKF